MTGDLMAGPMGYVMAWPIGFNLKDEQFRKLFPSAKDDMTIEELFSVPHTAEIAMWCVENNITVRLWPMNRFVNARVTFANEADALAFKLRWL